MPNTALNRTTQTLMTNKSGGSVAYGGVVIVDTTADSSFTTTTTAGLSTSQVGVVLEPAGIANNAQGMVAVGGWCPKITLNTAATRGQFIKTHSVAGQGTPHSSPQVEGDFAVALEASSSPACNLFGSPNGPTSGTGTVTNTGTLTSNRLVKGNGSADITVGDLSGDVTTSGSMATTIASGVVTLAKIANASASSKLVGSGASGSGSSYSEITLGTNLSMSGTTLNATGGGSGVVVQVVNTQTGTTATGSTVLPFDNTIPQNTEGDQYMSLSITPTSSTNKLKIDVVFFGSVDGGGTPWVTAALFQDSTANALAAMPQFNGTSTGGSPIVFTHYMTAGTTSSTTFKVRAGVSAAATMRFNGSAGAQLFGGTIASSITISEIVP